MSKDKETENFDLQESSLARYDCDIFDNMNLIKRTQCLNLESLN